MRFGSEIKREKVITDNNNIVNIINNNKNNNPDNNPRDFIFNKNGY